MREENLVIDKCVSKPLKDIAIAHFTAAHVIYIHCNASRLCGTPSNFGSTRFIHLTEVSLKYMIYEARFEFST